MSTSSSPRFLAALTVAASSLVAAGGARADTVEVCAAALAAPRVLDAEQFNQMRGRYTMADGSVLRISGDRRHPLAVIDDGAPIALHAVAGASLASEDGRLRIETHPQRNGDVDSLSLIRTGTGAASTVSARN